MRRNLALDIAVFQDFDAVHACLSRPATDWRKTGCLGLSLVPHMIQLLFLGVLECGPTLVGFLD
jgi:hypothetical protein